MKRGCERPCTDASANPNLALVVVALVAAGVAAFVLNVELSFRDPNLRSSLEIVLPFCALASAWMLRARFQRSRRLSELLAVVGLLTLGLMDLGFYAGPEILGLAPVSYDASAPESARMLVGVTLAAATLVPQRWQVPRLYEAVLLSTAATGIVAIAAIALPISGHQANSAVLIDGAACFLLVAGAGFMRTAARERQAVTAMLGCASITIAIAGMYELAMPTPASGAVSGRELLRAAAYAFLVVAGLRYRAQLHQATTDEEAARERRRLVNDLHDGLAQDLAFISAHGDRLARELGHEHPIVVAARRALHTSRGTIVDLSAANAPTPAAALRAVADEISSRSGVNVVVHADSTELTSHEREELIRIAREAMSNAAQHGHARKILVSLQARREQLVLRVDDDGCGIGYGVSTIPQRGFGLSAMRRRAESLGGQLHVRPRAGGGTEVEVVV
jgi:signal transduction histidine kinase